MLAGTTVGWPATTAIAGGHVAAAPAAAAGSLQADFNHDGFADLAVGVPAKGIPFLAAKGTTAQAGRPSLRNRWSQIRDAHSQLAKSRNTYPVSRPDRDLLGGIPWDAEQRVWDCLSWCLP